MHQTQNAQRPTARTVTARGGETKLIVMDRREGFPTTFALMATNVADKVCIRISGGCKGMNDADKAEMIEYFTTAFRGYRGLVWSGGTRSFTEDGGLSPMVTDLPGFIATACPEALALGSTPRTDILRLKDESRLVLDGYGTGINPAMSGVLVVQNGADGKSDWDGDLDAAFGLMSNLKGVAGFRTVGVIAWNGGPITEDEVIRSAKAGWPTIVVNGSGRAADEITAKLRNNDESLLGKLPKGHDLCVAERNDPSSLRSRLKLFGFIQDAA